MLTQVRGSTHRAVPWSAAMALFCLVLCGVVAGLYPASKAAALDPLKPCGESEEDDRSQVTDDS